MHLRIASGFWFNRETSEKLLDTGFTYLLVKYEGYTETTMLPSQNFYETAPICSEDVPATTVLKLPSSKTVSVGYTVLTNKEDTLFTGSISLEPSNCAAYRIGQ